MTNHDCALAFTQNTDKWWVSFVLPPDGIIHNHAPFGDAWHRVGRFGSVEEAESAAKGYAKNKGWFGVLVKPVGDGIETNIFVFE